MTLKLELPNDLESQLSSEAQRLGLALDQYALQLLRNSAVAPKRPTTGAELVAYWKQEGVIGSRPDIADSATYARNLRELAQRRRSE